KTKHACITRGWVQQSRKHLEHGSFPGAIWTEKPDKLAFLNLKRDLVGRSRFIVSPPEKAFDRTPESTLFAVSAINLGQVRRFNCWHMQHSWYGRRALCWGSCQVPLQHVVDAREQMRDGFLRFVAHVREPKSWASNLSVAGITHQVMFLPQFLCELEHVDAFVVFHAGECL